MAQNFSLKESVNAVKNLKATKAEKVNELVKIGLPFNEAYMVVQMWDDNAPRQRVERAFAFTFGVEIECDVERFAVCDAFNRNGVARTNAYGDYTHHDEHVCYKFVRDGSLNGDNPIECVSPVLNGNKGGYDNLKAAVKSLNEAGARVNRSCGLHVHVGGKITDKQYVNVFVNYQMLEALIDTFMAASRRGNASKWCRSLAGYDFSTCLTPRDVSIKLCSRYFKVNPDAWSRHKTIEFRQHQGAVNFEKIEAWVKFVGALVGWSKNNRLDHVVTSIDEIPFLNDEQKAFFKRRQVELNGIAA